MTVMPTEFLNKLNETPLVAILRGIIPGEIADAAQVLVEAGFKAIEVPLNSPEAIRSIDLLVKKYGNSLLIGAGTVLSPEEVAAVAEVGGRLIVSPDMNPGVIEKTVELGLVSMPGFGTATEAFSALSAGASILKLFPAATYGTAHLSALKAVLPKNTQLYAVGGVGPSDMARWFEAGASGVGFGSNLYKPGMTVEEVQHAAQSIVETFRNTVLNPPSHHLRNVG